jgi:hypothetical protein
MTPRVEIPTFNGSYHASSCLGGNKIMPNSVL